MDNSKTFSFADKMPQTAHPGSQHISSFILKTFEILENPDFQDIISWSHDGKALMIKNPKLFAERVLPVYFKHSNLSSFVRQLNMYSFKKTKDKVYDFVFSHQNFQRAQRSKLNEIRRRNPDIKLVLSKHKINIDDTSKQNSEKLLEENTVLKKIQKEMVEKIKNLSHRIHDLQTENYRLTADTQNQFMGKEAIQKAPGYVNCPLSHNFAEKILLQPQCANKSAYLAPFDQVRDVTRTTPKNFQISQQNAWPLLYVSSDPTKPRGVCADLPIVQTPSMSVVLVAPLNTVERKNPLLIPIQQSGDLSQKEFLQPIQSVSFPFSEKSTNAFRPNMEINRFCN